LQYAVQRQSVQEWHVVCCGLQWFLSPKFRIKIGLKPPPFRFFSFFYFLLTCLLYPLIKYPSFLYYFSQVFLFSIFRFSCSIFLYLFPGDPTLFVQLGGLWELLCEQQVFTMNSLITAQQYAPSAGPGRARPQKFCGAF